MHKIKKKIYFHPFTHARSNELSISSTRLPRRWRATLSPSPINPSSLAWSSSSSHSRPRTSPHIRWGWTPTLRLIHRSLLGRPDSSLPPTPPHNTTKQCEDDQSTNCTRDSYNDTFMFLNPGSDFFADGCAFAIAIGTFTTALTGSSIEKILLHGVTDVGSEFGGCA